MEGRILRANVVGMEIRLRGPGFESRQKQEISLFSKTPRHALGARSACYSMGSRVLSRTKAAKVWCWQLTAI